MPGEILPNEAELLVRIAEGDEKALAELMQGLYRMLYGYGIRICPSDQLVKDAIQDVFISFWQKREQVKAIESPRFYLMGALKRQILKKVDKKNLIAATAIEDYGFSDTHPSQEEVLINLQHMAERDKRFQQALKQLSDRQREAVYLKYYTDADCAAISRIMEISTQSVYNLLYGAMQKLKQSVQAVPLRKVV